MENQLIEEKALSEGETPFDEPILDEECPSEGEDMPIQPAQSEEQETEPVDYNAMAEEDLKKVRLLSPELAELGSLAELPNASRFGELRELGLSVPEALGALGLLGERHDSRSHLSSSVPRRLGDGGVRMSVSELEAARRLFPRLDEREIARLYRRVNR
jgi:hypothetical protein